MIDILSDMKKTLIVQRKQKKFGPPPIIEMKSFLSIEEIVAM